MGLFNKPEKTTCFEGQNWCFIPKVFASILSKGTSELFTVSIRKLTHPTYLAYIKCLCQKFLGSSTTFTHIIFHAVLVFMISHKFLIRVVVVPLKTFEF